MTQDFRETKIKILSEEHSRAFQEAVIEAGGGWWGDRGVRNLHTKFLFVADDLQLTYCDTLGYFKNHEYKEIQFPLPVTTKNVWSGEDMPPIGTVCEYLWGEGEWRKCEIVAYYFANVVAVDAFYCNAVLLQPLMFRPIKTPEQMAAEERRQVIDEMIKLVKICRTHKDIMHVLYDAGYRKTEGEL